MRVDFHEAFLDVFQNVKNETRTDSFVEVINYEICQRLCPTPLNEFKEVAVVAWLCKFPTVFQSDTKIVKNCKMSFVMFDTKFKISNPDFEKQSLEFLQRNFGTFAICNNVFGEHYLRDIFSATAPHEIMERDSSRPLLFSSSWTNFLRFPALCGPLRGVFAF